ncbi:Histone deacetylase 4 [Linnemannia zychae]|nr:Histone deacetylase 4 [Linnemannia zychae]
MDLKLLLSPAQKDSETDSAASHSQASEDHATTQDRQTRSYPSHDPNQRQVYQQPYPQHSSQQQQSAYSQPQQQYGASPRQNWQQEQEQQQSLNRGQPYSPHQQRPYYQQQMQQQLPRQDSYQPQYSNNEPPNRPQYSETTSSANYDYPQQQYYPQHNQQQRGSPYGLDHEKIQSRPNDGPQQQNQYRPVSSGMDSPGTRPSGPAPPILSISASTPLAGESPQPPQYFVPTHKPNPPVLPPPTGLNLSSYSFLLMEKRDREREALERANQGYLKGVASSSKGEPGSLPSPLQPAAKLPDPKRDDSYYSRQGGTGSYPSEASYGNPPHYPSGSSSYNHPPLGYDGPSQHYSGPPPGHYYHSSSSTHIGQELGHGRSQDYASEPPGSTAYPNQPHQYSSFHHRAMSPSLLDKPRFNNANLSVFRQNAAEDSDGNASVSSSGSHKRRRRPKNINDGKRSLLPGSTLGAGGGLGLYLTSRNSSRESIDVQEEFYDDDSDDQLDMRNGLQGLNLQKSNISGDRSKKSRTKTERPFKIGELVESMKSDTNGTWFAGRVLDLEDDPHDHINPKSVLIHFEGFAPHHDEWVKPSQLRACSTSSSFLRYGPNGHEPQENWVSYEKFYHSELGRTARRHTGLAYDRRMLLHKCQCNTNPEERHHPEQPERLVEILGMFQKNGMLSLVKWIQGREATIEELIAAHTDIHVRNYCCTAAQNRQYALENGLEDSGLQIDEEIEEDIDPQAEDEDAGDEEEEEDKEIEVVKKPVRRGRPRKSSRGNILVPTTRSSAANAVTAEILTAEPISEDTDMAPVGSPTDATVKEKDKDAMEVDLHSPALGRRRSSMRGSIVRMSSLVSMSSTLYAQREEDMVPDDIKEAALAPEDDDDDDDKSDQVGPPPSEAALAVAGGMDPSLASQLPQRVPKLEERSENKLAFSLLPGEKRISPLEVDEDTKTTSRQTAGEAVSEKPKLEPGISAANVIDGERRTSRSMQGQSGAMATELVTTIGTTKTESRTAETGATGDVDRGDDEKNAQDKSADKSEQKDSKAATKKKGHQAVSPAPMPTGDSVIIRPPGLTFTMSCGQLGIAVDTTWNPFHSSTAAKVAAGSLITLVDQVVTGRCKNGFAIIRPPGHHAEEDEAMGFCFFNNVGVAVNLTLQRYPLTVQKILIIDWDVHHGNGTQQIFYENPNVLYISLHRWDNGHFYPFTGAPDECGEEAGEGTNVNIAWSSYGRGQAMGDVEYIAAFWYVLLPIARQFGPDLVMVSAGFDAADGHAANIGGYTVSPQGFAILTRLVQTLAGGRVILSLEGGYEFEPLALSATACLEELLPHSLLPATAPTRAFPYASFQGTLNSVKPNAMAVSSLHQVLKYQQKYWNFPAEVLNPNFRFQLPVEWKASNSLATRPRRERTTRRKGGAAANGD